MTQPKYRVIANFIKDKIGNNDWQEGFQIPSETELAQQFSASRMTARKAVDVLVVTDLLERMPSIGTFVKAPMAQSSLLEIKNISDEILARGHLHKMEVLSKLKLTPNESIAYALSANGDTAYRVVILHYENDVPIQVEERFVNAHKVPHFLEQDFSKITANEYLTSVAPLTEAQLTVEAINPSKILKHHLKIDDDIPCLKITRVTYSHGTAISYAVLYYPADRYKLTSELAVNG